MKRRNRTYQKQTKVLIQILSRDMKGTLRTPHTVDYEFSKTQAFKGKLIGENVVGRGV